MKYFIQTFGCAANEADSERISSMLEGRGMTRASSLEDSDHVIINTCMVRRSAEDRAYGLIRNLGKQKKQNGKPQKIIVTGCLVGAISRDSSGKLQKKLRDDYPEIDEFLPIEEVGFDFAPIRSTKKHAIVPISNGCNNFCTFCIVPFTRGREISRPFEDIVSECKHLAQHGFTEITLVGQNVNSYGADLVVGKENIQTIRDLKKTYFPQGGIKKTKFKIGEKVIEPTWVKHLGRFRLPTLFPFLLSTIAAIPSLKRIDFISSNPWDFTDQLIKVIVENKNVSRQIHLPVQSGSDRVLKRMDRWYTSAQYLELVSKLRNEIADVEISTDIIVGFPGETKGDFQETVNLAKKAKFFKAYLSIYSPRPLTAATKSFPDDIPFKEKKRRWLKLEKLINKPSNPKNLSR